MIRVLRFVAVIATACVLAACSASDFSKPVTDFSDTAKKAAASLSEYERTLDQVAVDANTSYALAHPVAVSHPNGECVQGAKRCRLVIRGQNGKDSFLDPGPVDPRIRAAMAAVVTYVDNLKAIVTADTAAAIKTASDAAATDAVNFAKAVDGYNAQKGNTKEKLEPQVAALAAPVSGVIAFGLSQYAEAVKIQALRRATTAMNQAMPDFMETAGAVADGGLTFKRNQLAVAFDNANYAFFEAGNAIASEKKKKSDEAKKKADDSKKQTQDQSDATNDTGTTPEVDRSKLVALQNAAQAYDSGLQLNASKMFTDLAEAHDKLTKAINEPEMTLDDFWAALQRISDGANKLNDLVKAVQASQSKK